MIFVLGSGRSGTHWLGYILESHPDLHVTIEDPRFFFDVTKMALDPTTRPALFPELLRGYAAEAEQVAPLKFADKSHPNIWLADELASALPSSRFVGIQRDPWGTIASMLQHPGVLSWHSRWREFPVPNQFLGITTENADAYDEYSTVTKCALRWRAHTTQMVELQHRLGSRLLVINYNNLFAEADRELGGLVAHLELRRPFPLVEPKSGSLEKWRDELTGQQVREIEAVVGFGPADVRAR